MKLICLPALVLCGSLAHAQQAPALPASPPVITSPGVSVLRPEYAPPGARARDLTVTDGVLTVNELRDLLRMQTEAIMALSVKIDSVNERLLRIETRVR